MPDASPQALSTRSCFVGQILKIVTAYLLINLVRSFFDKPIGAGVMYSATAYSAGSGEMYFTTGAGATYTVGSGEMRSTTGAGAAKAVSAGTPQLPAGAGGDVLHHRTIASAAVNQCGHHELCVR